MALAAALGRVQIISLLFAVGGMMAIASQQALARLMAPWTSFALVILIAINAAVVAGPVWAVFRLLPLLTVGTMDVLSGATSTPFTQLIDARL